MEGGLGVVGSSRVEDRSHRIAGVGGVLGSQGLAHVRASAAIALQSGHDANGSIDGGEASQLARS